MKQQEVFKKIGIIIQELNEQYEYLQTTVNDLNDLELELFVANTHFLKDHAEILRKLNAVKSQPAPKTSIKDEPKWFEPMVQPVKPAIAPFKFDTPKPVNNDGIQFEIVQPKDELQFEQPEPIEEPEPFTDLVADAPELEEEPETIRHELLLDEADNFEDEEEGQSQDETLLTPVAEIEEEAEEEEPEAEEEAIEEEEEWEPTVAEVEPKPLIEEIPEPVAEAIEPEPVIEEKEDTPLVPEFTLFNEPKKNGNKALAESMEDIQVESLMPTTKSKKAGEEKEAEPVLTLNQRLSAQKKEIKPESVEVLEPLADIKSAITLNDKLLFVKDLFKGYNLAYTEAIEIVNRFTTFEEADRFLQNNYVTKNNWEGKKETSDKFYALLRRRYA
ncbi:hypothetical protein [Mucilaginibacter psychrotolerans]|uniref:Uncharacterized protein n=1 Tax=Mucilaginibacter psychrotolerans TaxID=1524096 RepID=A0A4Y8SK85_9SPHI|nr:hypothetical protein [Mucilaginibacter psychrotolerans]TFF38854.1 hypothetical protein E2R66_07570 [Mucilaginibacter psychrotolerans]